MKPQKMKRVKIVAILEIEDDEVFDHYQTSCSAMTKDDTDRMFIQAFPEAIRNGKVLVSYAEKGHSISNGISEGHIDLTIGIESTEPIKKVEKITGKKKKKIDPRDTDMVDAILQATYTPKTTPISGSFSKQLAGQYAMIGTPPRSGKTAFQHKIEELQRARETFIGKPDTPMNRREIDEISKMIDYEMEQFKRTMMGTAPPPIMLDIENTPEDIMKRFGVSKESLLNLKKKSGN